jgi:multidrug efflux pump
VRTAITSITTRIRPKGFLANGLSVTAGAGQRPGERAPPSTLPIIVAYRNGAAVRLADVAARRRTASDRPPQPRHGDNGKPALLLIIINRHPNANIHRDGGRHASPALLPELRASIPSGDREPPTMTMERTTTVRASLHDVERTLVHRPWSLVTLVVFLFLRASAARRWVPRDRRADLAHRHLRPPCILAGLQPQQPSPSWRSTIATRFVVEGGGWRRHRGGGEPSRRLFIEKGMAAFEAAASCAAREVALTVVSMSVSAGGGVHSRPSS